MKDKLTHKVVHGDPPPSISRTVRVGDSLSLQFADFIEVKVKVAEKKGARLDLEVSLDIQDAQGDWHRVQTP